MYARIYRLTYVHTSISICLFVLAKHIIYIYIYIHTCSHIGLLLGAYAAYQRTPCCGFPWLCRILCKSGSVYCLEVCGEVLFKKNYVLSAPALGDLRATCARVLRRSRSSLREPDSPLESLDSILFGKTVSQWPATSLGFLLPMHSGKVIDHNG